MRSTIILLTLGFSLSTNSMDAQTLLVDFGGTAPSGSGNQSFDLRTLGTNADFRANDGNISPTAEVVNFDFPAGDQLVTSNAGLEAFVDIAVSYTHLTLPTKA